MKILTASSSNILAIDASLRNTGWATFACEKDKNNLFYADVFKTSSLSQDDKFCQLLEDSSCANKIRKFIEQKINQYDIDTIIVEMPYFSQAAKTALQIGMLWGALRSIPNLLMIEPKILKDWSGSKRGDHKKKVIEKVVSRVFLTRDQAKNDNITDAVGIGLMFTELVYHELKTTIETSNPSSFNL